MVWKNYDPIKQMPHLYEGHVGDDGVIIPTTDDVAYENNKDFRWLYNKMTICQTQKIPHGPLGTSPTEYPVCVKPVFNLFGGSIGSIVCHTEEQYRELTNPGTFWSRYAMGEHYSIDFILKDGEIMTHFAMRGEKLQHGAFDYWELIDLPMEEEDYVCSWIWDHMGGYTGVLNVEMIGCQIIEAQLRMGDLDRLGDHQLMDAIYNLHNTNTWDWEPNDYTPNTFFIAALFGQSDTKFSINIELFDYICADDLVYYQFDDPDLYFTNPFHGNRIAVFCDDSLDRVIKCRNIAAAMLKPDLEGKYVSPLLGYTDLSI